MKAILLSAGKGTRMLPLTKNTPKCLLHVGNGLTVLETQLETLKKASIKDICIVTGYLSDQVEAKVRPYEKDLNIRIIYNPFYDISNNLVSLWTASSQMDGDFMIINGDDLFQKSVIEKLLAVKSSRCMVIDQEPPYREGDMKVEIAGGRIVRVSKQIPSEKAAGESIGMMKFTNGSNKLIQAVLDKMVRKKENLQSFYLEAVNELIKEGHTLDFIAIPAKDWAEIDFHPDYELVMKNIDGFHRGM
ncbi:phosphocholine cytidylyltransferase family protein [Candidatus Woesearchaeota archaeon]|nr:phosphocholine cytidylyltransferase family protein [Candidatus Woesearchaeota archaeon]